MWEGEGALRRLLFCLIIKKGTSGAKWLKYAKLFMAIVVSSNQIIMLNLVMIFCRVIPLVLFETQMKVRNLLKKYLTADSKHCFDLCVADMYSGPYMP